MAKLTNLARMTTATTGTGTITLGAAVSGYLTFAASGVANGDVVDYAIKDGVNSEHGTGTYTSSGTTLTRTVTKSTNGNAPINLSGTAEVFISPRAETLNDAAVLTTGTLADARLSSNVPLKNAANTFTTTNTFTGGTIFGNNMSQNGGTYTVTNGSINTFFASTGAGSGDVQINSNIGAAASLLNPAGTGMPGWFLSTDAGGSGAAGFSLHRSAAYAINFGLDTDNNIKAGGWSDGNTFRFRSDTSGNFVTRGNIYSGNGTGFFQGLNATKAWVQFTGSTGGVLDSFNVSSVTRSAAGDYTVNFSTAMPSANYAAVSMLRATAAFNGFMQVKQNVAPTTTALSIVAIGLPSSLFDPTDASIVVLDS